MSCEVSSTVCGTPSGWRGGGRCWRCRMAHNADTARYRAPSPEDRAVVLAALRAGASAQAAADSIGIGVQSLHQLASRDGELRAALDGAPERVQQLARRADYLHALARTAGDRELAALVVGVSLEEVEGWRADDETYRGLEDSLMGWVLQSRPKGGRGPVSDDVMECAIEMMEGGTSVRQTSRALGVTRRTLYERSRWNPRLAAAMAVAVSGHPRSRPGEPPPPEAAEELRKLWADPALSLQAMAAHLGVSRYVVKRWASLLDLPSRSRTVQAGPG